MRGSRLVDPYGRPVRLAARAPFESGGSGRRWDPLYAPQIGVNTAVLANLDTIRARVRALYRNNPLFRKGIRTLVASVVGTGPTPRPRVRDLALRAEIKTLWEDWAKQTQFYRKLVTMVRSWALTGEGLGRLRLRRPEDGLVVPLDLQVLAPDHLPTSLTKRVGSGRIIGGVEFDPIDRIAAYHLYREHPGDTLTVGRLNIEPTPVPAADVVHLFTVEEAGQVRGVPSAACAVARAFTLDMHDDAQLERQKVASVFAGFLRSSDGGDGPLAPREGDEPDAYGGVATPVEIGGIAKLPDGYELEWSTPPQLPAEYESFQKLHRRDIAVGVGVLYEHLTGDYQGVTFSSVRAAENVQHRELEQVQFCDIHPICDAVYARWMAEAVTAGRVPISPREFAADPTPFLRVRWIPDGWDWVDPEAEMNAFEKALALGLTSRQAVVARQGWDVEDIDEERREDAERERRLGLTPAAAAPMATRTPAERTAARVARGD